MDNDPIAAVAQKFSSYPEDIAAKLFSLRELIIKASRDCGISNLEETLKWGEPAYLSKQGSTIRIDWKPKSPEIIWVFFNCKTTLIETFKELYLHELTFDGNRGIALNRREALPKAVLLGCFAMALRYHKLKALPLLGAK